MEYSDFLATKPGDKFLVGSVEKVAVARVPNECVLFADGSKVPFEEVGDKILPSVEEVEVNPKVYEYLANRLELPVAPSLPSLQTGDYVLRMVGYQRARVLVVAVIDSDRNTAYSQNGEMIPLGDPTVIRSGFWTENKNGYLTEKGRETLSRFYV